MSNVVEFPDAVEDSISASLSAYARRAREGEFASTIVVALRTDGSPEFKINVGDADTRTLLTALGMLDVIRARIVRVIEAEGDARSDDE